MLTNRRKSMHKPSRSNDNAEYVYCVGHQRSFLRDNRVLLVVTPKNLEPAASAAVIAHEIWTMLYHKLAVAEGLDQLRHERDKNSLEYKRLPKNRFFLGIEIHRLVILLRYLIHDRLGCIAHGHGQAEYG